MPCRILLSSHSRHTGPDWSAAFEAPLAVRQARRLDAVRPVLEFAEAAAMAGRWVVFFLTYEAAPAFDPAMQTHALPADSPLPLAWAASFAAPCQPFHPSGLHRHGPWRQQVDEAAYADTFRRIREQLRTGEIYQVNYTLPFSCSSQGDALAWHQALLAAMQPGFGAFLDLGEVQLLSCSPELFFHRLGDELLARPMKGTVRRGRTPAEDAALANALMTSPKERAENVMIVDLLRNDLGRVARPGGVWVDACCRVEAYPTVWQMVSDVRATLRPGVRLAEILAALFPCGSITGAPKLAAMRLIRELEPQPRGVYCGAIGLIRPGGEVICSVPIRTLTRYVEPAGSAGRATCSVGGGVTWDSTESGEFAECQLKLQFADPAAAPFALLESLLLHRGRIPLLEDHLARCRTSAAALGFAFPEEAIRTTLADLAKRSDTQRAKLRLLVEREGSFRIESHALPPVQREVLRLAVDSCPVDTADPLLPHKTTCRVRYDAALARFPEAHDVILYNARGELTECCYGNLVLDLEGQLLTPSLCCGLLPGVRRARLLACGAIQEAVLSRADLQTATAVWRINAVRGWQRCRLG